MTAQELIDSLEATHTGKAKIERLQRIADENPEFDAQRLLREMTAQDFPEGTIEKAEKLLGGANVKDFEGTPPPNSEESKMEKLAVKIGQAVTEAHDKKQREAQETGQALPVKPAPAKEKTPERIQPVKAEEKAEPKDDGDKDKVEKRGPGRPPKGKSD